MPGGFPDHEPSAGQVEEQWDDLVGGVHVQRGRAPEFGHQGLAAPVTHGLAGQPLLTERVGAQHRVLEPCHGVDDDAGAGSLEGLQARGQGPLADVIWQLGQVDGDLDAVEPAPGPSARRSQFGFSDMPLFSRLALLPP